MAEWPADRLLFATDYFWRDVTHIADWVRRFRPDPADQAKIFSMNARHLLGIGDGERQKDPARVAASGA